MEALRRAFDELPRVFDWSAPTLVIAECVLAYLPPGKSVDVVKFFGDRARRGAFVAYDPIEPDDAFGRQMMRNVESRGCAFAGIRDAPTVDGARERFLANGWRRAVALDMNETSPDSIPSSARASSASSDLTSSRSGRSSCPTIACRTASTTTSRTDF